MYFIYLLNLPSDLSVTVALAIPSKGGNAEVIPRQQAMRATRNIVDVSSSFSFPRKSDFFQLRGFTFMSFPFGVTGGMALLTKGVLGRSNFWRILQSPFFGFLGICMCGPEEDLVQGGRFLMEPERFIKFFNSNIFKIIL